MMQRGVLNADVGKGTSTLSFERTILRSSAFKIPEQLLLCQRIYAICVQRVPHSPLLYLGSIGFHRGSRGFPTSHRSLTCRQNNDFLYCPSLLWHAVLIRGNLKERNSFSNREGHSRPGRQCFEGALLRRHGSRSNPVRATFQQQTFNVTNP